MFDGRTLHQFGEIRDYVQLQTRMLSQASTQANVKLREA
jgi:hypothetical protein